MAVAKFKKISLIGHNSVRPLVMDDLQLAGCVHITDLKASGAEGLKPPEISGQEMESALSELDYILNFLKPCLPPPDWKQPPPEISLEQLITSANSLDYTGLYKQCREIEQQNALLNTQAEKIRCQIQEILPWVDMPYPLDQIVSARNVQFELAEAPVQDWEAFVREAGLRLGERFDAQPVAHHDDIVCLLLTYLHQDAHILSELRTLFNVEKIHLPEVKHTPRQYIVELENELERIACRRRELEAQVAAIAAQWDKLALVSDYFSNRLRQIKAQALLLGTPQTFIMEGWIPAKTASGVKTVLEEKYQALDITLSDPAPDEAPPIEFENRALAAPFEEVTKLYGIPNYREPDPTPLLAPFFFLFFGLCIADVGYGLVMTAGSAWLLKYTPMGRTNRKMLWLFVLSGISTMLCGAITGSWFGDMIDLLPPALSGLKRFKDSLLLFDPIKESMVFMTLSVALGFIQVCTGVAVSMYNAIKARSWYEAFAGKLGWLGLLSGLAMWLVSQSVPGLAESGVPVWTIKISALALFIFGGRGNKNPLKRILFGFLELYNVIAYLADMLSYTRLLALGLAGAVLAVVINKIAIMTLGIPFLGYLIMLAIMLGGHAFNLAIGGLGAFVHSARLQFVEFFPKFFQGGGVLFNPFKWETKYIWLKK